jgi:hypothetical protein
VRAWGEAWQRRSAEAYLSFYSTEFRPAEPTDRAEWERERRARWGRASRLIIEVRRLEEESEAGASATVYCWWIQRSGNGVTESLAILDLERAKGGWKILRESLKPEDLDSAAAGDPDSGAASPGTMGAVNHGSDGGPRH